MDVFAGASLPTREDYRRYDRIWQKVSPSLDPYPEVRAAQAAAPDAAPGTVEEVPCCMGNAAQGELEVIRGFLREELADAQLYRKLAGLAPTPEGKRVIRRLAAEAAARAKALQSVHFLITGGTYDVTVMLPPQPKLLWRDRLRERYHAEACGGFNYARAGEETEDVCLKEIFANQSREKYQGAELLRQLLEKTL